MNSNKLSKLEGVSISEAWANELAFSEWLAREENIDSLGQEIGLDLGEAKRETSVGPFFADVYCKDMDNDRWVVIENQFRRTDHDHLGKLLTYAAGLEAVTVVWIAEEFRPQHRQALDWLNNISIPEIHFFGVEIKLWRIDNSSPASKFSVVSEPNDWAKAMRVASAAGGDERNKKHLEYWAEFQEYCRNQESVGLNLDKPRTSYWMYFPLGDGVSSMAHGNILIDLKKKTIDAVVLLDDKEHSENHFDSLAQLKNQIEQEAGVGFDWKPKPGNRVKKICLKEKRDPNDKKDWGNQHKWLYEKASLMRRVFYPHVKKICDER